MNDQYKNSYKATAKELVSLSVYNVCAFSRDHLVNQVVVADSGSPLIEWITFLESYIVD